jgi:hypothetical protein
MSSIAEKIKLKLKEIEEYSKDDIKKSDIKIENENELNKSASNKSKENEFESENENEKENYIENKISDDEKENENNISNIVAELNYFSNSLEDSEFEIDNGNFIHINQKNPSNIYNKTNNDKILISNQYSLKLSKKNSNIHSQINEIDNTKNVQNLNEEKDFIKYSPNKIQKITQGKRASIKTNYCTDEINNKNHYNYIELENPIAMESEIEEEENDNENFYQYGRENYYNKIGKKLIYKRSKTCLDNRKNSKRNFFLEKIDYSNCSLDSDLEIKNIDNIEYEYNNESENGYSNYENCDYDNDNYNDNYIHFKNNKNHKNNKYQYNNNNYFFNQNKRIFSKENYLKIEDDYDDKKNEIYNINYKNENINFNKNDNFVFEENYSTRKSKTNSLHINFCNIDIINNDKKINSKTQNSLNKVDPYSNTLKTNNSNYANSYNDNNNISKISNLISCSSNSLKKSLLISTLFILLLFDPIITISLKIIDLIKIKLSNKKSKIGGNEKENENENEGNNLEKIQNENQFIENYINIENLPDKMKSLNNNNYNNYDTNNDDNKENSFENEKNLTYYERYYNFFFINQISKNYRKAIKSIFIGISLFGNLLILASNMEKFKFVSIFFLNNLYLLYNTLDLYNDELIIFAESAKWNYINELLEIER